MGKEEINKYFFDYTIENGITPVRKDFVEKFKTPGREILAISEEASEILEEVWGMSEKARGFLAIKIMSEDKYFHTLLNEISSVPLWALQAQIEAYNDDGPLIA